MIMIYLRLYLQNIRNLRPNNTPILDLHKLAKSSMNVIITVAVLFAIEHYYVID